ncbi:hypothetical protein BV25DRAFT_1828656 [Artomyces pyxidatus]|uniref:Uncharacterized protein n=1 Tax=Artomyces pyxidatus TaxID=48021 RepID=A0ACB8ST53_9AGAM|nr:hypothetical protein BV25DRAFT_1828656 [Artomyces pyxidatus]
MVFQKLPSTLRGIEEQHRDVVVQRRLSDVMIDSSQDLIVWVETVSEAPVTVRHHLRALSTGDVHPLACDGGYIALKYDPTRSSEAVADICGDYLLLEMFERSRPTAGWEHVVYNWKTGTIVFSGAQGPWGAYQRTRFLDPWHLILDVSASYHDRTVGIKVVQFRDGPSAASIDDDISYTYFFLLPAAVQNISTIIESHMSPWRASSSGGAPGWFHSDPAERLLVVNAYAGVPSGDIAIHVSVRMLLAYVRSHPPPPAPVPWEAWGLECARVVLLPQKMLGFLVHGMRTVAVSDPALQTRPTMTVLDYHPRRVARALARDREARILSVNDIRVEHDPFPVTTSFPCLKTEVPVPDDLARLFSGVGYPTLRVFLCEDGVMVTEVEQIGDSDVVKNAWTFTI